MTNEPRDIRIKRLTMRSWRRGTKEMDMILGPFADARLADLDPQFLDQYETLLEENDQDLYIWVTKAGLRPDQYVSLLSRIADFHGI